MTDKLIKLKAAFTVYMIQAPGCDCNAQTTISVAKSPRTKAYASSLGLILKTLDASGKEVEILYSGPYSGILDDSK